MANFAVTKGKTLGSTATAADFHDMVDNASVAMTNFTSTDITGTIPDSKLATITTASKVNTSALTTTSQAAGDVMYNNGTNWVRLAKDAGKFLKSGASAVSWDSMTASTGMVVQVTNASTSSLVSGSTKMVKDDTKPTWAEGVELSGLSIAHTAVTSGNKLVVKVQASLALAGGYDVGIMALYKDASGTNECVAATCFHCPSGGSDVPVSVGLVYYDTAADANAHTYAVRAGGVAQNIAMNGTASGTPGRLLGGASSSSITIIEVKA